jgi:hypothetical protein
MLNSLKLLVAVVTLMGLSLGLGLAVDAQPGRVDPSQMEAHDYELINVAGTAIGFTSTKITKTNQPSTRAALCTLEGTATMRYRMDGTDPTGSEGHLMVTPTATVPVPLVILGTNNVLRFRAIQTAGAATLRCTYLR